MIHRHLALGSLALLACDGTAAVQRVELSEHVLPEATSSEPEEIEVIGGDEGLYDPLASPNDAMRVPCAGLSPRLPEVGDRFLTLEPQDLTTATGRMSPGIAVGPGAREAVLAFRSELRLLTYPERSVVSAELEESEVGEQDGVIRMRFLGVPPLEDRWYAIEVSLPPASEVHLVGARNVGGRMLARFRPDSGPVVAEVREGSRDGRYVADILFSERLTSGTGASSWTLRDERGLLPCTLLGPTAGRAEAHAVAQCDRPPLGRLVVDFGGVLETVLGTRLRDRAGTTLTHVAWRHDEDAPAEVRTMDVFDAD